MSASKILGIKDCLELQKIAGEIATSAAALIRKQRAELQRTGKLSFSFTNKTSAVDPVTVVDRAAEEFIVAELKRLRPQDGLLGEEGSDQRSQSGITWIIDPIDGTVNFLYGIPAYAVSIAATLGNEILAGAVINVVSQELYLAARGHQATRQKPGEEPITLKVSGATELGKSLVATGFSYEAPRRQQQAALLSQILPRVRDIRRIGSAALDLCRLAEGSVDLYYEHGLHPWDFAAGTLIAREAGAKVYTPNLAEPERPWTAVVGYAPSLESQWQQLQKEIKFPLNLES
ncbi:inositol monophosphatase family protein [Corynebacterium caspium]|uniref:inositol monophosphatase family protein n=1 Tax=Corynebacterium caspium TaxID=234828 RepID=UPI000380AB00|nr:inositol monophosphatase family protein [Corynebacterium caspium]WKD59151.1 Inositol-1-monophosphatase SuhB [Corynebacterium caspium DSM 44850]